MTADSIRWFAGAAAGPFACLLAGLFTGLFAVGPAAQGTTPGSGSSAVEHFSESRTTASGGSTGSATYALTASFGFTGGASSSTTYRFDGGFPATLTAGSSAPWLTAASPRITTPLSQDLVWLSGTRLAIGAPSVSVSGRPATVVASSPTHVAILMPNLSEPGWHEIELQNQAGRTTIERGIGVLPILDTEGAPAPNTPFDIVFRGTKGDSVIWMRSVSTGPKFPFGPYLHGLTLGAANLRIMATFAITADSGEFRFPIPPVSFPVPVGLNIQALFITNNPAYAPGSFSNMYSF